MCNIITFSFACQHTLRRRRSRCGGTKHKITANSTKAACVAESFLTIYLRIPCGPCQHTAWEAEWKLKLERANIFLTKLRQRNLPGVEEITALVKGLEADYTTASWHTRTMFTQAPKASITRVKHSEYERKASRLSQEVRPEDVIDKTAKEWAEMNHEDYDDNYVASTDPIHPVSTDYSHPLDDDDGAWILRHLSTEDVAATYSDTEFDFDNADHGWSWADDSSNLEIETAKDEWQQDTEQDNEKAGASPSEESDTGVMVYGPAIHASSSTTTFHLSNSPTKDEGRKAKVDQVISTFWAVVNHETAAQNHSAPESPPSLRTDNDNGNDTLITTFNNLIISTPHTDFPTPPSNSYPATPIWTDGPSDTPPPTLSSLLSPRLPLERSPNSTRAWYDKQRVSLLQRQTQNGGNEMTEFYSAWLKVSRCEIRDFEGCEGRTVKEPPAAKASGVGVVKG
jgi:hypothetical protein